MFRFYYSYDLMSELEKELQRDHKMVQLMVDEYDLFLLSIPLIDALANELAAEIVVISTSQKKSMKLVNLCKRLIDMNVQIYWKVDKDLFVKEDYFAIFDKEYLISKYKQEDFDNPENLVRSKNDFFNGLTLASKKLSMFDGDILINFELNQSIVYPGDEVILNWEVQNAHEIQIEPLNDKFDEKGVKSLTINKDTKFTLVAKNKGVIQKKSLYVRVLKRKEINFNIEVFDPIVKEYIALQTSNDNSNDYAVYSGQKVKLSWNIKMLGKLLEAKLGNLPLAGSHEFEISKKTDFSFVFQSMNNSQRKMISIHCFENKEIFNEPAKDMEIKSVKNKFFFKKILYLVIDYFRKIFY